MFKQTHWTWFRRLRRTNLAGRILIPNLWSCSSVHRKYVGFVSIFIDFPCLNVWTWDMLRLQSNAALQTQFKLGTKRLLVLSQRASNRGVISYLSNMQTAQRSNPYVCPTVIRRPPKYFTKVCVPCRLPVHAFLIISLPSKSKVLCVIRCSGSFLYFNCFPRNPVGH